MLGVLALAVVVGLAGSIPNVTTNRTQAGQVAHAIAASGKPGDIVAYCPDQLGPAVNRLLPAGRYRQTTFPRGTGPVFVNWVDYAAAVKSASAPAFAEHLESMAGSGRQIFLVWAGGYQGFSLKCEGIVQTLQQDPDYQAQQLVQGNRPSSTNPCTWCVSHRPRPERRCARTRIPNRRRRRGGRCPLTTRQIGPSRPRASGRPAVRERPGRRAVGWPVYGRAVVQVLPAWVAARVLVARQPGPGPPAGEHGAPDNPAAHLRVHQGLLAWDGGWYEAIAGHGYATAGRQSVRFFPGYPMAARVLGWIPGIGVGTALMVIANLCALAAMAALLVLVRHDLGDSALARRSVWLLALAPSAYSLVLGYADAALMLCAVVTFLAARSGRWWWAAVAGLVAGLVRPVGILLVVPVVIEVWRSAGGSRPGGTAPPVARPGRRDPGRRPWAAPLAAVVAPVAGTAAYLGWVGAQFGDPWLPLRVQQQNGHRGALTVPLAAMWHNLDSVVHGHHVGSALHIPWVVLSVALLVVAFRRLPLSYAAFATAVLAVSITSSNLDSFERYALGAFPLVIAASTLTSRRGVEVVVLALAGAGLVGYAFLAFSVWWSPCDVPGPANPCRGLGDGPRTAFHRPVPPYRQGALGSPAAGRPTILRLPDDQRVPLSGGHPVAVPWEAGPCMACPGRGIPRTARPGRLGPG